MANIKVLNMAGAEVGTMELNDAVFGAEINQAVLHAAVRAFLLNQRQGTQSTLTRAEVSGGGNTATAGAQLKNTTVKDALDALVASIDKYYEE